MAEVRPPVAAAREPAALVHDDRVPAALRYFDRTGPFSRTVRRVVGLELPDTGRASCATSPTGASILAWRSPTEAILLCEEAAAIDRLRTEVATHEDGCLIDLAGGASVLRGEGEALRELFASLGGQGMYPEIGAVRRGRLADVAVSVLKVRPGEILVVVDLMYREHLLNWVRAAAADLAHRA